MEPATRWLDESFAPLLNSDERFARQHRIKSIHQCFHWLRSHQAKIAIFRVLAYMLSTQSPLNETGSWWLEKKISSLSFPTEKKSLSLRPLGFSVPHWTRMHVKLLGPCFKTGRARAPLEPTLFCFFSLLISTQKISINSSHPKNPKSYNWDEPNRNVILMNKKKINITLFSD